MSLLMLIVILSLLLTFSKDIIKKMQISKILQSRYNVTPPEIEKELEQARAELRKVQENPSQSEYTQMIKTMRAENKVRQIEEKKTVQYTMSRLKSSTIEEGANYAIKTILTISLIILSISNRYTPVVILDKMFNLTPLGSLVSFPTGVPNAISTPVWIFCCNSTFRLLRKLINARN